MSGPLPRGVAISGPISKEFAQVLSLEALDFVAKLHRKFESRRQELLVRRAQRERSRAAGPDVDEQRVHVATESGAGGTRVARRSE